MFKFSRTVSLPSVVILGITLVLATRAVAADAPQTQSNSAPVEVKSTDSMAQSQQLPTERYGCFSGYRERTYQGERPVSYIRRICFSCHCLYAVALHLLYLQIKRSPNLTNFTFL